MGFPGGSMVENPSASVGYTGSILGSERSTLEKDMATHSSILAWKIPWTQEPGGLHGPRGHKRVRHDLATKQQQHGHAHMQAHM